MPGFGLVFLGAFSLMSLLLFPFVYLQLHSRKYVIDLSVAESFRYGLVLGAGLEKDGHPSEILMDRIESAVELYKKRKVDQLIMSGSTRKGCDEPQAMRSVAITLGIPDEHLELDIHGSSTFASCLYYAGRHFSSPVLIITQHFHLPRDIMLQRALGVSAFGYAAKLREFSNFNKSLWYLREVFSLPYNFLKLLMHYLKR